MTMNDLLVNIAKFKERLTEYLAKAERGENVVICRRNVPVVRLEAVKNSPKHRNRTRFGSLSGTAKILGDLTEPFVPESDWETLK